MRSPAAWRSTGASLAGGRSNPASSLWITERVEPSVLEEEWAKAVCVGAGGGDIQLCVLGFANTKLLCVFAVCVFFFLAGSIRAFLLCGARGRGARLRCLCARVF